IYLNSCSSRGCSNVQNSVTRFVMWVIYRRKRCYIPRSDAIYRRSGFVREKSFEQVPVQNSRSYAQAVQSFEQAGGLLHRLFKVLNKLCTDFCTEFCTD